MGVVSLRPAKCAYYDMFLSDVCVVCVIVCVCGLTETKLEVLYPSIRYKMASALANWHPSDKSAHKILEPWVPVSWNRVVTLWTCLFLFITRLIGEHV